MKKTADEKFFRHGKYFIHLLLTCYIAKYMSLYHIQSKSNKQLYILLIYTVHISLQLENRSFIAIHHSIAQFIKQLYHNIYILL